MNCLGENPTEAIKRKIEGCLKLLSCYEWLHDALVHDFYVERHWERMPKSWRKYFSTEGHVDRDGLANFLDYTTPLGPSAPGSKVAPLELLALRACVTNLSITRKPVEGVSDVLRVACIPGVEPHECGGGDVEEENILGPKVWRTYTEELSRAGGQHKNLHNLFRRHVKPKKQHEIARLSRVIKAVSQKSHVTRVVDVGSGVGHLSRLLSFGHGLKVTSVDGQANFVDTAGKFDNQLERSANKKQQVFPEKSGPDQVAAYVDFNDKECLQRLTGDHQDEDVDDFCVTGLHTCGDLASTLVNFFCRNEKAKALVSVGCCYMKLTPGGGFPLSSFVIDNSVLKESMESLGYLARELSCHAIEQYTSRLRKPDDADKLKVHCHRALLELLISNSAKPELKHSALKRVPRSHTLPFKEYAKKATSHLDVYLRLEENSALITEVTTAWWDVVTFYSMRLLLAPVIETAILLDRMLFVYEQGYTPALVPIFDPELSPRNHVLVAVKKVN